MPAGDMSALRVKMTVAHGQLQPACRDVREVGHAIPCSRARGDEPIHL